MKQIKKEIINKKIEEEFIYDFNISKSGLYLIEIIASAKSWWQKLVKFESFQDDDLFVRLDEIDFPKLSGKKGLFNGEAAWNGNNLGGLSKTNLIVTELDKGNHVLKFYPHHSPNLVSINVVKIDSDVVEFQPTDNNPPEDGNCRQWITVILADLPLKSLCIKATADRRNRYDADDIKLIIDGQIRANEKSKLHKNWYWCGQLLKGQEKEFSEELNLPQKLHYIELWADKTPMLKTVILKVAAGDANDYVNKSKKWWEDWKKLKEYTFRGNSGDENYNRYDEEIKKAVAYWNYEFFRDSDPPKEPLDPNLLKAVLWQESIMGYDPDAKINIMQVGNYGDDSLNVLNGRGIKPEYELKNGKLWQLDYKGKAKITKPFDSIYWGTRWLYHKAQRMDSEGHRHWDQWKSAVSGYGPGTDDYIDNIWSVYTGGFDKRGSKTIKLWSFIMISAAFPMILFSNYYSGSLKTTIKDSLTRGEKGNLEEILVYPNWNDPSLFSTILVREKDWWENIKVGRYQSGSIKWLKMEDAPGEQSVLGAEFVRLEGFDGPLLEVYGQTHAGHGSFYLYEIGDNEVKLLLNSPAVDINNDTRWLPESERKYGYENCGEIFSGGKLASSYRDLNRDGISDVLLSGAQEIVCVKDPERSEFDKDNKTRVADIPAKKIFLWDKDKKVFLEKQ